MKTIKFRPLRIIKKTGKITVSSYLSWRKVATADYNTFNLIIVDDHKKMGKNELVYNHKGELLYFYDYNPSKVPVFNHSQIEEFFDLDLIRENNEQYGILWSSSGKVNYRMDGTDCDGVPCFSHYNYERTLDFKNPQKFKPLTVEIVLYWYGWFLWRLENSKLIEA